MSRLLSNPKALTILVVTVVAILVGVVGGAVGQAMGAGFLSSPLAQIELAAEPAFPKPLFGGWVITNSMLATWLAIILILFLAWRSTRRLEEVPRGLQNFMEAIIEAGLHVAESVAGREKARKFLPLVMTIFLFIVTANWLGVLPGFGTIGWLEPAEEVVKHAKEEGEPLTEVQVALFDDLGGIALLPFGSGDDVVTGEDVENHAIPEGKTAGILIPFLRSANTDVNTPLAIALVAMTIVQYWGISTLGLFGHLSKFINFRSPIQLYVGLLEGISEFAKVISFTFRLFGNIFAGEVLLFSMAFLIPLVGLVPFLGLELFVGFIQAFVFAMLTLVFATMATVHHGGEEEH